MHTLEQRIVFFFFILEISLVALFVIATYLAKVLSIIVQHRDDHKSEAIASYLKAKKFHQPPPYLKHPDLILEQLDDAIYLTDAEKEYVVEAYLLAIVRPYVFSINWLNRYYLLEAYQYIITPDDQRNLIILIRDPMSIISINAMGLSHHVPSHLIYQVILKKLINLDYATQKIYIAHLHTHPLFLEFLYRKMAMNVSIETKILCYRILAQIKPSPKFFAVALRDIQSSNRECQLAAIPVFAESDPNRAKSTLLTLLHDKDWLVRNKAVQALADIKLPNTLDAIVNCLNDESRWVRVNAAKALIQFGQKGQYLLSQYQISKDTLYPNLAAYFLDIERMKEQL